MTLLQSNSLSLWHCFGLTLFRSNKSFPICTLLHASVHFNIQHRKQFTWTTHEPYATCIVQTWTHLTNFCFTQKKETNKKQTKKRQYQQEFLGKQYYWPSFVFLFRSMQDKFSTTFMLHKLIYRFGFKQWYDSSYSKETGR